jgi:hypothetical protein
MTLSPRRLEEGRYEYLYLIWPRRRNLSNVERLSGAEGVRMPEGMPLDELALRVLVTAALAGPEIGPSR